MGRKGVKTNQADLQSCNSVKTYMVQDKADQSSEQVVEIVEGIISPPKDQMKENNGVEEEGIQQKDEQQPLIERGKDMENLQAFPTKRDMAGVMSHLECMIKGELNATRMDIQNVLQRVEESETHLDEHKKVILELRARIWIG